MECFTIDLDGPVFGVDYGGRGQPVVLVHGLGGSHHNWNALAPHIAHLGHVYALDLRGFGRTPPAGRGTTVDANQRLVHQFIEHLDAGPAMLIGNSMGGMISMMQAAREPSSVSRLVLISPAAPAWDRAQVNARWAILSALYLVPGVGHAAMKRYESSRTPEQRVHESFTLVAADAGGLAPLRDDHIAMARERRTQPWAIPAVLDAYRSIVRYYLPRARYDNIVSSVQAPTLLVHGKVDRVVPFVGSRRLASLRPDWTFAPLNGVGHVAQMEVPDLLARLMDDWIGGAAALSA